MTHPDPTPVQPSRRLRRLSTVAAAAVAVAFSFIGASGAAEAHSGDGRPAGAVYVIDNQVAGNHVVAFDRAADGTLTAAGTYATGGTGTGAGLGSQGALALDDSGRNLYVVNAGSDSITSFDVTRDGLRRNSTVPSGGDRPVSVSVRDGLLYAVNAGGDGNVSGFRVDRGRLTPLAGSTRALSGPATAPAQVAISPDGDELVVTEKATSLIDVYKLDHGGVPVSQVAVKSSGSTPFGFAFTPSGRLAVSEAGPSALSTYAVGRGGLRTLAGSVGNNQAAACWVAVTEDGRFAYTGNGGGSQSVSGYRVGRGSSLSLLDADGRTGVAGAGVSDIALSHGSGYLYARLGNGTVAGYDVGDDGSLSALPVAGALPAGSVGIAAR